MIFNLVKDEKVTVWLRQSIAVEAETIEQAIEIASPQYIDAEENVVSFGGIEMLHDTEIPFPLENNNGDQTIELYLAEDMEAPIFTNKPDS